MTFKYLSSKTWDNVVSHTSSSRNESNPNTSDDDTTVSRQGEERVSLAISHTSMWGRSLKAGHSRTT